MERTLLMLALVGPACQKAALEPEPAEPPSPSPAEEIAPMKTAPPTRPAADADPHGGRFTLEEATAGLTGKGKLEAVIETTLGTFTCELFEKEAPLTVANFVGLARGLRAFKDTKGGGWVKRPYYDGIIFHRVIPNFMIQGGDPLGVGSGGPGYDIADEFHPSLEHDRPGILSMANRGPNTGGSQFFITERPTPHLDGRHAVFGVCAPVDLVGKIARVPVAASRPTTDVVMKKVEIRRQ